MPTTEASDPLYDVHIVRGVTDTLMPYVPGVNCLHCGQFVGRDGYIGIGHYEMSNVIAYVEGECARCLSKTDERGLMTRAEQDTEPVVAAVYQGDEAKTLLAQAQGYKRIVWLILTGVADRDPAEFISQCKVISQRAAEDGA